MQAKNDLLKTFKKAATRAALAVVLTVGIVTPLVDSVADQPVLPPQASTQTAPPIVEAAPDTVRTELSFTRVNDLEALAKQYPVLASLPQEVKDADEQQGGDNPAFVEISKQVDKASGRELLFVHLTTPVLCSYEGCPLAVYMKDANNEFRKVLQINASDPIELVTAKGGTSLILPGAYGAGPGLEFRFDNTAGEFQLVTAKQEAPAQQAAPKPTDTLQIKP
ncbi:MAG TPA: hypothetical protein VEF76_12225 [Patescibacteria group bacterium]|nr:hypothetical protein [Patescibacteria group bacterium]